MGAAYLAASLDLTSSLVSSSSFIASLSSLQVNLLGTLHIFTVLSLNKGGGGELLLAERIGAIGRSG